MNFEKVEDTNPKCFVCGRENDLYVRSYRNRKLYLCRSGMKEIYSNLKEDLKND